MSIVQTGLRTTIRDVELKIARDVGNANITVGYHIDWSKTDQLTNQPHEETFRLIGVDDASEGGVDDAIQFGVFIPYRSPDRMEKRGRTEPSWRRLNGTISTKISSPRKIPTRSRPRSSSHRSSPR